MRLIKEGLEKLFDQYSFERCTFFHLSLEIFLKLIKFRFEDVFLNQCPSLTV